MKILAIDATCNGQSASQRARDSDLPVGSLFSRGDIVELGQMLGGIYCREHILGVRLPHHV